MKASLHHWPELLHDYIERKRYAPFVWGKNDCCLFACDAVFEMTGFDLAIDFRGGYNSALSAVRAMRRFVGPDCEKGSVETANLVAALAEKIAAQHSIHEIPTLMAQRGDVVLLIAERGESLGIVGLRGHLAHAPGPAGIVDVPLAQCVKAWRIPKA